MDLSPFKHINPCGYQGLKITQLSALPVNQSIDYPSIEETVIELMAQRLAVSTIDRDNTLPTTLS